MVLAPQPCWSQGQHLSVHHPSHCQNKQPGGAGQQSRSWMTCLIFIKLPIYQFSEVLHRRFGIRSGRGDGQLGALRGGKHHDLHDALAINALLAFGYHDIARKPVCCVYQGHGGPRVQPEAIGDRNLGGGFFHCLFRVFGAAAPVPNTSGGPFNQFASCCVSAS